MICTIFQYIPFSEEENGSLVELTKKAKEDDCSDDDAPVKDDSVDSDADTDLFIPQHFYWCHVNGTDLSFQPHTFLYQAGVKSITTPPPRA
jgi:hypothetical protein